MQRAHADAGHYSQLFDRVKVIFQGLLHINRINYYVTSWSSQGKGESSCREYSLEKETEKRLTGSIRRFFTEELDEDIGDLKALRVLEFFILELGPNIYNQAISDAQKYFQEKASDLGDSYYQPEFDFWKKQ